MARRVYVRDLNILLDLDRSLGTFASRAQEILDMVGKEIRANKEWLAERCRYWSREVEHRHRAYRMCLMQQDKDGRGGGCGAEAAALREAEEALELARRWSARVEQAIGEYAPYEERMGKMLGSHVGQARADLSRSIEKYRKDIGAMSSDLPSSYRSPKPVPKDISRQAAGLPASGLSDEYTAPQGVGKNLPRSYKYADYVYSFSRDKNPDIYENHPDKADLYAQLAKEYPDGVRFDAYGFPDFSPYAVDSCEIEMTGDSSTDIRRANAKTHREETPGYTWHHCHDLKTMLLVPTYLHDYVPHTGGAALVRTGRKIHRESD